MPLPRPAPGTFRWWVIGTIGCAVGTGLAVWLGLANSVGQVTWQDTSYHVVDDASVTVDFDIHRPSDTAVRCTIGAIDVRFGTVGTAEVTIPSGSARSVHRHVVVRTTSRANTGTVKTCVKVA